MSLFKEEQREAHPHADQQDQEHKANILQSHGRPNPLTLADGGLGEVASMDPDTMKHQ